MASITWAHFPPINMESELELINSTKHSCRVKKSSNKNNSNVQNAPVLPRCIRALQVSGRWWFSSPLFKCDKQAEGACKPHSETKTGNMDLSRREITAGRHASAEYSRLSHMDSACSSPSRVCFEDWQTVLEGAASKIDWKPGKLEGPVWSEPTAVQKG